MQASILIISNGPLCRNPRVVKEAGTLADAGYEVTVLTVRNHAPSEIVDRELMLQAPFGRVLIDMLPGYDTSSGLVTLRRLRLRFMRDAAVRLGWKSIGSLGPAQSLLKQARKKNAELTIVHNEIAHWVGVQLLAEGRRVCADIEDWHSEDLLPQDRARRPLAKIRNIERTLINRAIHSTTTSHALADALHARYGGRRPYVLTNSFPLRPIAPLTLTGEAPAFFWFSQTLGSGRGLESFLAAWKLTHRPSRLVLLGEACEEYRKGLLESIPSDRRSRVFFLPLVPPEELPTVIARHDIGLALEQASILNRDLTITNKILQYLNAGLAVVASNTAGQREVLARSPDAGVIVQTDDAVEFARQIDTLLTDREALVRRRRAARHLAESVYCWERESPQLLGWVARALAA